LPDKDSIYFSTSIDNDKFHVHWPALSKTSGTIKTQIKKDIVRANFDGEIRTNEIESFPPIVGKNARILILGTMPGKDSLRLNEYYANPRNTFWRLVYKLEDSEIQIDYQSKIEFLKQNEISIWDVCHKATRETSLDADIKDEVPNNIQDFLVANPSVEIIAFNGKKAEKLYDKYFERSGNIKYLTLLSTSPANASYTFQEKLEDWGRLMNPDA
jgi:hypoxanthine-DNA glycosylase